MAVLAAVGENRHSEKIITAAHDLASTYGDELIVLHVVPKDEFTSHKQAIESIPGFTDFSLTQKQEGAAQYARKLSIQALDGIDDDDSVTARGRVGDPVKEILAETTTVDPRYLVIGGQRRSPTGKAIFGSATQKILLATEYPVLTIMLE